MVELVFICSSGFLVGSALGLTGSGGSLFAIPLLLYVVGLDMKDAVPLSLLVIGSTALLGAVSAYRKGVLLTKPTLIFGITGIAFTPLGFQLGSVTPEPLRILSFSILAMLLSVRMFWQSFGQQSAAIRVAPTIDEDSQLSRVPTTSKTKTSLSSMAGLALGGACVGILSGLFGVGGGILIVPTLMLVIRVDMSCAVASSLAIIAMISLTGGALGGIPVLLSQPSTMLFGIGSLLGMLVGRVVSNKIAGPLLQRMFSSTLFLTGATLCSIS